MVHFVGNGTAAKSHEFEPFDYIVTVDGKRFSTSKALYRYLKSVKQEGSVKIKVKRGTLKYTRLFDYYEMKLPVEDLEWIKY